jgi:hypothetical protein
LEGCFKGEGFNLDEPDYVADARFDLDAASERVNRAEAELRAANDAHIAALRALDAANERADDEHQAWKEEIANEIGGQEDRAMARRGV